MRPQGIAAPRGQGAAQGLRPISFRTKLGPPGPQAPGGEMQRMFVGEAHGAMGLMGDAGNDGGRLGSPDLRHRQFKAGAASHPETNGPYWIHNGEKSEFVDNFAVGDEIPGIIVERPIGDRGNITAKAVYSGGAWVLEIARALDTGSEVDVQFDNLEGTYHFGVAVFDNAQVRHSFQTTVSALEFGPRPTAVAAKSWGQVKEMMR